MVITPSYIPLWIVLSLVGFIIGIYLHRRKHTSSIYLLLYATFYVYLLFVLRFTQFPIYVQTPDELVMSYGEIFRSNLIFIPSLQEMTSSAGLLNVLLFIPFGFGIGFLLKMNVKRVVLFGLSFSLIIESLQFLTMVTTRFSLRTVNVNDLINNTLGALIGYLMFFVFINVARLLLASSMCR